MTNSDNPKLDIAQTDALSLLSEIDSENANEGRKTAPRLQATNESLLNLANNLTRTDDEEKQTLFRNWELYNEKNLRALAADELAAELFEQIDISKIYCNTTGRPIGPRDKEALGIAIEIHGMEKMRDFVWMFLQDAKCEYWKITDPKSLERLAQIDPCGFFVFCANLLIQRKAPNDYRQHNAQKQAAFEGVWLAQKVALFSALQQKPIEEVIEHVNVMISILGFLEPKKLRETKGLLPFNSLISFIHEKHWKNLRNSLRNACAEVIKRHNPRIRSFSPEQLAQMQTQIGGIGFMRALRISDYGNSGAYIEAMMEAYGGFDISNLSLAHWRASAAAKDLKPVKQTVSFKAATSDKPKSFIGLTNLKPQSVPMPKLPTLPKKN